MPNAPVVELEKILFSVGSCDGVVPDSNLSSCTSTSFPVSQCYEADPKTSFRRPELFWSVADFICVTGKHSRMRARMSDVNKLYTVRIGFSTLLSKKYHCRSPSKYCP